MNQVRISIIGAGEMGLWLANFLKSESIVKIYDIDSEKIIKAALQSDIQQVTTLQELVTACHILIIATPTIAIPKVIDDLQPFLHPNMVLIDIASIKSPIIDYLTKATQLTNVLSIHPLFGSKTMKLKGKTLVLMSVTKGITSNPNVSKFINLFTDSGAKVVEIPIEEHDELMSPILNLSHLINVALAMTLRTSSSSISDILQFATTTFNAQLTIIEAVAGENINHYSQIQMTNPYSIKILDQLIESLVTLRSILSQNDIAALKQIMMKNRDFLIEDSKYSSAKDNMYRLLDGDKSNIA